MFRKYMQMIFTGFTCIYSFAAADQRFTDSGGESSNPTLAAVPP
jgi:hypothetical protein